MDYTIAQVFCGFPVRLHPVSNLILDYFNEGRITTAEFLRYFSLPNSDYIEIAACYVTLIQGLQPVLPFN